ncbi:MAG: diguanylate cyclase [Arenimonas sp.]|nr:diguanylate cyclase [Arenimonas sp.]
MHTLRARLAGLLALALLTFVGLPAQAAPPPDFELAVMDTPVGTTLDDILSGRAQPGFTPVLTPGFEFNARDGRVLWVRIRTDLPPAPDGGWRLHINRVPLDRIKLVLPPLGEPVAEASFFTTRAQGMPWPDRFVLPVPKDLSGPSTLYLQMEGRVRGGLHIGLQDASSARTDELVARRFFRFVYGLLLAVAALSLIRHLDEPRSGALAVGGAALATWLACLGVNGHLYSLPEVSQLAKLGAVVPQALLLLGAGPLVLATRYFSGLTKSAPTLVPWVRGLGWLMVAGAVYGLLMSNTPPHVLQLMAWVGYALAGLACLLMLLLDARGYRWLPILALLATSGAVALRLLAHAQVVPATLFNLYGWQLALAVTVALFLLLPWVRSRLQRWSQHKRSQVPEPTAEEKIGLARGRLVESLQAGLANAADADLKWIAFRRLLDGLKPVLPQTSAAVVAMHYHGEDLLQVEPRDAEDRYRELLSQRATLLKNLSRLRAPQQVGIDFDGPGGPLEQVQLAVIPLPIPKPGWGALLVERRADITYTDAELALCAEFAAVAIVAGDEAATTVHARRNADTDLATGVLRTEPLLRQMAKLIDNARQKQQPLSLLYITVDQLPTLREAGGEVGATAGLRPVADLLREEGDYGDLLGRCGPDGFLLVSPGKALLKARDYAEKLRGAISRLAIDPRVTVGLTVSIGIAQAGHDERDASALVERAGRVAQIATKNGGNQIFS